MSYRFNKIISLLKEIIKLNLDDIFTIDNPEFEKHIPDIYPTELQLNKANTSDRDFFP